MASLTKDQRDALPDDSFGVPGKRKLPLHDATHVKLAWDQVDRTKGLTDDERSAARQHILRRAKELGLDTKTWSAQEIRALAFHFDAVALDIPAVADHPNRKPFRGVLTFVDQPSDAPPGGASGKRVMIPSAVAEAALDSLLGMAVDCADDFGEHDVQQKIGLITAADVVGNEVRIEGFGYAKDFPDIWAAIDREKKRLGFSYEIDVRIHDLDADIWVASWCVFTGAAILYKDKAAYRSTSLAAQAEEDSMTPEELKKLNDSITALATAVAGVTKDVAEIKASGGASLGGPIIEKVKPHVEACNAAAAAMEAAGIGTHPDHGHVRALRHVAQHMAAEAVSGRVPSIYNDHSYFGESRVSAADKTAAVSAAAEVDRKLEPVNAALKTITDGLAGLNTLVTDLKAKSFSAASEPTRRTLSPEVQHLMTKVGLKAGADGALEKKTVAEVDEMLGKAGIKGQQAIAAKLNLQAAGVL